MTNRIINKCDIVFIYTNTWIDRLMDYVNKLIRFKRKVKISHVGIYIGGHLLIEADWNGVQINTMEKYYHKKYKLYFGRVLKNFDKEGFLHNTIKCARRIKHSYGQMIVLFFKKIFNIKKANDINKKGVICSEFVLERYRSVGINLVPDKYSWECTPYDIYTSALIEVY